MLMRWWRRCTRLASPKSSNDDGRNEDTFTRKDENPMIYLLNTPILTAYGDFRLSGPIEVADAKKRLAAGFTSAIGHEASAIFLSTLLATEIPVRRIAIEMQSGDTALVLRLKQRLPEGKLLSASEMADVAFDLAWLERLR